MAGQGKDDNRLLMQGLTYAGASHGVRDGVPDPDRGRAHGGHWLTGVARESTALARRPKRDCYTAMKQSIRDGLIHCYPPFYPQRTCAACG